MSAKNKSAHVSDVLAEVFKRGGMKRAVKRAEAVLLWSQVVGREVAKFTEAKALQDGVLLVEVSDSETSMHLMLQRQRFVNVYQGKFGLKEVRDIRFRVGRPRSVPDPPPPPKVPPVDSKDLAKLAKAVGTLPESLSRPTMQAAKAMLAYREQKKAEGWSACKLCGALSPTPELCDTCERYAEDVKVQRASQRLAKDPFEPTPLLSEDERAVAVHLAKGYLMDKLRELLPHVLADPGYKEELEFVARCYVAHELDKPLDEVKDEDLDVLENRVARALGRWR